MSWWSDSKSPFSWGAIKMNFMILNFIIHVPSALHEDALIYVSFHCYNVLNFLSIKFMFYTSNQIALSFSNYYLFPIYYASANYICFGYNYINNFFMSWSLVYVFKYQFFFIMFTFLGLMYVVFLISFFLTLQAFIFILDFFHFFFLTFMLKFIVFSISLDYFILFLDSHLGSPLGQSVVD